MKVKMLTCLSGEGRRYKRGQVVDLPAEEARRLVGAGQAIDVFEASTGTPVESGPPAGSPGTATSSDSGQKAGGSGDAGDGDGRSTGTADKNVRPTGKRRKR